MVLLTTASSLEIWWNEKSKWKGKLNKNQLIAVDKPKVPLEVNLV